MADIEAIRGRSVLVAEDEPLVGLMVQDMLTELGWDVAALVSHYDEALEKAAALPFDVAVLDVNLAGRKTFPVAEILARRGLPFVFATGYGAAGIPAPFHTAPVVRKPFERRDLERALRTALETSPR